MDEKDIPIDINTTKLLDWLISRRHVDKNFQNNVIDVREKISSAIRDMPAHDGIVKLLFGQHINYFHCMKIIEILKETEADTKNLFGRYGSQRMKDWQDIQNCYQRDNLYLAEAAQILIRNVNYEIPSLKRQIAKLEQTQVDCEKKLKEQTKAEVVALNEFNLSCKQLGITGNDIKKELLTLLSELPEIYERVVRTIVMVKPAVDFYTVFIKFHSGLEAKNILPLLNYLMDHGNTTTYEYTYGEKPIKIEIPQVNDADEENNEAEIDFGSINVDSSIDFVTTPVSEDDIDWGNLNVGEDDFEIVEHRDLNIHLEESGRVDDGIAGRVDDGIAGRVDDGIARGNDAYTVLDNPKTQSSILNNLMELESFLKLRLYEMSGKNDLLAMSEIDAPTNLQMQTIETVTAMHDRVKASLSELLDKKTQHLHNVKHSAKYVDILTASLKQKLNVIDRAKTNKKISEDKICEIQDRIKKIEPVLTNLMKSTKLLQAEIESDVSKIYKGRPANIVGAVNVM